MEKKKHIQMFTGGMNTVISPNLMPTDNYHYMLNCDVTTYSSGNVGVVTPLKGNMEVKVNLPSGDNKTIGVCKNEESNKMYYAVHNSNGYHGWYEFDYISLTVKRIFESKTDSGGVDILQWKDSDVILSVNIVDNKFLYWSMDGHPARCLDIEMSINNGYGDFVLDKDIKAVRVAPPYAPEVSYFYDLSVKSNHLYGNLFQFCARYIYYDNKRSVFSDFSIVPLPDKEPISSNKGIPLNNNGINITFNAGGKLVSKIEIAMRKTDQETGGVSDWVSVAIVDKSILGIGDGSTYTYKFYNNNTYLYLDPNIVRKQKSDFPRNPKIQEFTYNRIIYGNYIDGFNPIKVDIKTDVIYSDLFFEEGTSTGYNDPSLVYTWIDHYYNKPWRSVEGTITVGPDVKKGNEFTVKFKNTMDFIVHVTAVYGDTSSTIAAKIREGFSQFYGTQSSDGYVGELNSPGGGYISFNFRMWNSNKGQKSKYIEFETSVKRVEYASLKDSGNSVLNEKMGSSCRYAIYYENDEDDRSLAFGGDDIVYIKDINELGEIKQVSTQLTINHEPPSWATKMSVVRTKNLSQEEYIQMLVHKIITVSDSSLGEKYQNVILGSLYMYQKVHPETIIKYEFKKGDRIKQIKTFDGSNWSVPAESIEYEVLDYFPEVREEVKSNISVDGSPNVKTPSDPNNIGSNIVINGHEREIMGELEGHSGYILNSNLTIDGSSSSSVKVFPVYSIINRRGILRIKMNEESPIIADGTSKFALVEIYKPAQTFSDASIEDYYSFGYKFDIYEQGGKRYHRGNIRDQDQYGPAVIQVEGVGNYVRNRELIANNSVDSPDSLMTSIEDQSYNDFYYSKLNSFGRPTRIDDSRGEVVFDDRIIWSDPFMEDTNINGLNMFNSVNRVDYNDKYGAIQRVIFYEGKMYIFKFLKTGWVPVKGSILTDTIGNTNVAISSTLLPEKMEYFLWEGGVGNNPESIVKVENDIYGVSPVSGVFFSIGEAGLQPTSQIHGIDNYARDLISKAGALGYKIYGGYSRMKNQYIVMIDSFSDVVYNDLLSDANMKPDIGPMSDEWQIVSGPFNGSVIINAGGMADYTPNLNYVGTDYFIYKNLPDGVNRRVDIIVKETPPPIRNTEWVEGTGHCEATGSGVNTGRYIVDTLKEVFISDGLPTGVTKPNRLADPDYISPSDNYTKCPYPMPYKWIPDPTSIQCEQEYDDIEEITGLKTPNKILLRNNGVDIFVYDYFDARIYKVNLDGLKSAPDKRNYIYNSPSCNGAELGDSVGGGIAYDNIRDTIYVLPPMSNIVRVVDARNMTEMMTITTPTLSSGTFSRSSPTLNSLEARFLGYGNGGFVMINTISNTIVNHSNNLPLQGAIPYVYIYNGNGVFIEDYNKNRASVYNIETGVMVRENNAVTGISGNDRVFRGFFVNGNKMYFTTVLNGNVDMKLTILNMDNLSTTHVSLDHMGKTVTSIGGGVSEYSPVDGILYICGHINNKLAVWRFDLLGNFISGYVDENFSSVSDVVYNPSNNKMLATVRGVLDNNNDGSILYLN